MPAFWNQPVECSIHGTDACFVLDRNWIADRMNDVLPVCPHADLSVGVELCGGRIDHSSRFECLLLHEGKVAAILPFARAGADLHLTLGEVDYLKLLVGTLDFRTAFEPGFLIDNLLPLSLLMGIVGSAQRLDAFGCALGTAAALSRCED